jgi:hypothetical protein
VHDHGPQSDEAKQRDVGRERRFELLIHHRSAAVLDDDGLVVEGADVRERLHENPSLVDDLLHNRP